MARNRVLNTDYPHLIDLLVAAVRKLARKRVACSLPALQRELGSFTEWRLKPINRDRDGVSVEAVTVAGNRADALRLLGWLKSEKNIAPSLGGVFGSERLDQAVQAFVEHLRACGRLYSTCAGYIKSFVAVARFVHAARVARAPHQATAVSAARLLIPRVFLSFRSVCFYHETVISPPRPATARD